MIPHESPVNQPAPRSRWQKVRLVIKVVELRLRFIALMAVTGLTFAYWDTIANYIDKRLHHHPGGAFVASAFEYYCPMHPNVVRAEPGTCPICGMPLTKRKMGEKVALPEGALSRVQLSPTRIEQAGVHTVEVAYEPLVETITTFGTVDYDERLIRRVVSKTPGKARIEKLFVNFQGANIRAGEPLAEIYSPELFRTVRELLLAQRSAREPARSLRDDPHELVRLAADKLRLWGITQSQLDEVLKRGRAELTMSLLAPIGGHVTRLDVREGQEVMESQELFEIADLSRVWIKAQVYEDQAGLVKVGESVQATVDTYPGESFAGTVAFIQPHLDPATRTVEVRYDLDNADHKLAPGMYATVRLQTPVADTPAFRGRLVQLPAATRTASLTVAEQKICPVTRAQLGSMGDPVPVDVDGRKVWTCCDGCPPRLKADPKKYLARLTAPPRDGVLSVPESAVIDTGDQKRVYVETSPGVYDGRAVVLGPRVGDRYPVIEGLAAGDKVAAAGAFLIDAESRLSGGGVTHEMNHAH
jgi:Cu(I)/Ag(I) efflux system membrane fusion protein